MKPWKKQCATRDYMDACQNMAIPGSKWCSNCLPPIASRPRIVCLCGSTRFWETFRDVGLDLTLNGVIVLSIGICAPDAEVFAHGGTEELQHQKKLLDNLHKRKIDLADEILVLNVDNYIGESTCSEILYAESHRKPVSWLYPIKGEWPR